MKLEHSGMHGTFVDMGIQTEDGMFVYKLFDKRYKIPFFIARILHFKSNILSAIFYSSKFFSYSQTYTKTRAFSIQSFRSLFKDNIAREQIKVAPRSRFKKLFKDIQIY